VDEAQSVWRQHVVCFTQLTYILVRLQSGSLAVFSPVALTDEVKAKVAELGEVRYICAPDAEVRILYQFICNH
jgi:hypothetical protein